MRDRVCGMAPRFSRRLKALADRVLAGRPVADVGTDHGQLAVYLVRQNRVPYVIASDNKSGPLAAARDLVRRARVEDRVGLRLGSGLEVLRPGEAATVVVAGIGGHAIARLAPPERLVELGVERIIVQASVHHDVVLEALSASSALLWREELTVLSEEERWPYRVDVFKVLGTYEKGKVT